MSRSNDSKSTGDHAIAEAKERMDAARRSERKALERTKRTGNPEHRREYIRLTKAADEAEEAYLAACKRPDPAPDAPRDTGWRLLRTPHGPRFHREIGASLQMDVEPQVSTWIACAVENRQMVRDGIRIGCRTQHEAARAIEIRMGVDAMPLPEINEGGSR